MKINMSSALEAYAMRTMKKRILKVKETTSMLIVCTILLEVGIVNYSARIVEDGTNLYFTCSEIQWKTLDRLLGLINDEDMQKAFNDIAALFK